MCTPRKTAGGAVQQLKERVIGAGIVVGGLLMIAGCILTMVWGLKGADALGAMWPFYLGGVVAVLLGWLNGELRC